MRTHKEYLAEKLHDKEFAREFQNEKRKLRIAYQIHTARVEQGLTQKRLAKEAGITQQMVSRVENADAPNMTLNTVYRISDALGMDIGLLPRQLVP